MPTSKANLQVSEKLQTHMMCLDQQLGDVLKALKQNAILLYQIDGLHKHKKKALKHGFYLWIDVICHLKQAQYDK